MEPKPVEQLIEEHWEYVLGILQQFDSQRDFAEVEYHYKTAFLHGFKHAMEQRYSGPEGPPPKP